MKSMKSRKKVKKVGIGEKVGKSKKERKEKKDTGKGEIERLEKFFREVVEREDRAWTRVVGDKVFERVFLARIGGCVVFSSALRRV
jgi:hypothetical protein